MQTTNRIRNIEILFLVAVACCILSPFRSEGASGEISSANKYAWSECAQWLNFDPLFGGIAIEDDHLKGYAWAENLGWIKLGADGGGPYSNTNASNWGVNRDANGNLSGYAWSEAGGWIRFDTRFSRVRINADTGDWEGYAWSERVGWIHFRNDAAGYGVNLKTGGTVDVDQDGDGFGVRSGDCDDQDPNTYPGAQEIVDGKDNNCDWIKLPGELDEDSDGILALYDCDDHIPDAYPGENCNGIQKAIIVAGGGPYPGNNLWSATRSCAVSAYSTLILLGFTPASIFYLTADDAFLYDPNKDTSADAFSSSANLEQTITEWATDPNAGSIGTGIQYDFVSDVLIYLVDHGGEESFRMNDSDILSAHDLGAWLTQLQGGIRGRVILIIDACQSGSFLSALGPYNNGKRIVIASASADESANFLARGAVSFSNYFWTQLLTGASVCKAFDTASSAIRISTREKQHPLLDDNGNQNGNDLHDGDAAKLVSFMSEQAIAIGAPTIDKILVTRSVDPNNQNYGFIIAKNVIYQNHIKKLWATIWPPGGYSQTPSSRAVIRLPEVTLSILSGNDYYGEYSEFSIEGDYQIGIYAMDDANTISLPNSRLSFSIENYMRRRAVILAGETPDNLKPAIRLNIKLACNALALQGYSCEDIYFLCPNDVLEGTDLPYHFSGVCHHESPSEKGMTDVKAWAASQTKDLVLYMIGEGENSIFHLNPEETITAQGLDEWLNGLQPHIPDKITVIYDASCSGSFLPSLACPEEKKRIVIASAGPNQSAHFLFDGALSFSAFFWMQALNGAMVESAFIHSKNSMAFAGSIQLPMLDDNGDGKWYDPNNGVFARQYSIGVGITLAGDEPIIGSISPEQDLDGDTMAGIWAQDVTTTGRIKKVWGIVTPPDYMPSGAAVTDSDTLLPEFELTDTDGDGRYTGTYDAFSLRGPYTISVYAMDEEENVSLPKQTTVYQYGDDDTPGQANVIFLCKSLPQNHKFNTPGDQDWVKFYAIKDEDYEIVINREINYSEWIPLFEVYESDDITLAQMMNPSDHWPQSFLYDWRCPRTGVYYLRIYSSDPRMYGDETGYELSVYRPIMGLNGIITGYIRDAISLCPIKDANVRAWIPGAPGRGSCLSRQDGKYYIPHKSATELNPCAMEVVKTGYITYYFPPEILVKEIVPTIQDVYLEPVMLHLHSGLNFLDPNVFNSFNTPTPITSYKLIRCLGDPDTVSAISRFNVTDESSVTTVYFWERPSGADFPIIKNEGYRIGIYMKKEQDISLNDLLTCLTQ